MGRPLPGLSSQEGKDVSLGMPGAWADENSELADHYTTKVGGEPDWPAPLKPLIKGDQLRCAVCGGYLGLVAQAAQHKAVESVKQGAYSAQIRHHVSDDMFRPERLSDDAYDDKRKLGRPGIFEVGVTVDLDFFVKSSECRCKLSNFFQLQGLHFHIGSVLNGDTLMCDIIHGFELLVSSWRTIRVQKNTPEIENTADYIDPSPSAAPDAIDSEWGGTSSRQGGTDRTQRDDWWDDNLWDGPPVEESSYAEGDSMNFQELQSSLTEAARLAATVSGPPNSSNISRLSGGQGSTGTSRARNINLPVLPCFYIYTQAESSTGSGPSSGSGPSPSDIDPQAGGWPIGGNEDPSSGGEDAGELWGSEEYEYDQALYADRTYSFDGEPLWAIDEHTDAANCAACGGPRVFEMQLMPPLLYYLQQAHKDLPPSIYGPDDWDWHTILVFSCAQSCVQEESQQLVVLGEKTDWSFIEEATMLQQDLSAAFVT
ncbi:hypothetical protein AXG93_3426s1180 [Marchantia polymorpha subsp. ruderalis]|uniref:Programmed cell death protein 2 C-terminal domain-containing protein n=1 Tax=Marchantia polymorpha subsp. ruderalis TaxID=1480154 RepID=A0A176VER4_MARPO|nr:hypothetical protein AXG93_3426s1180 [Marchantia polymorpha subsp. ruderalis]